MIYSLHYKLNKKEEPKQVQTNNKPIQMSIKEYTNINDLDYNKIIDYINNNDLIKDEIKSPLKKIDYKILEEVKRELN